MDHYIYHVVNTIIDCLIVNIGHGGTGISPHQ